MMTDGAVYKVGLGRSVLRGAGFTGAVAGLLVCGLMAIPELPAQSSHASAVALPSFEVASVRPTDPHQREIGGFYTYPGGRTVARGCTLQYLVMLAFHLQRFQVSGGPGWIDNARFDIQARPPESSQSSKANPASPKLPPSDEQRQMLQSLLVERFHLQFHRETRQGPVYVLSKGSKTPKLNTPKDKGTFSWAGDIEGGLPRGSGLRGENISMPQLAERLSQWLERPVLDQTGLQGSFDFEFRVSDGDSNATTDDVQSSIFSSLKGIGLNLKAGKSPVETIVIDRAEEPSPN